MNRTDKYFTLVKTHKHLAEYLEGKEDEQRELIGLLRKAGVTTG